ncbi:DUF2851 family protein [Lewinella sp. LCG006]|uniref:DUF2851 family protein n=1 Tax=Lewinella sp. LCG006 TaxID=3231911 RepID=UPI003461181D
MREDFLHFVWRLRRFRLTELKTTTGQALEIIHPGQHNHHAGPDFLDARIRIDGTLWAGNVEMHLRSSEWHAHKHQDDPNYNNVILHVVLEEDVVIRHHDGERIPCLDLRNYLPVGLAKQYLRLLHSENWVPCQQQLYIVPEITFNLWLDRLLVERLEERTQALEERLNRNGGDWEETFYQSLAWGFGLKVNADPFLMLAESLPLKTLLRHKNSLPQMEALLFGQAGLLEETFADEYPRQLQKEYQFLKQKYQLQPMSGNHWKFMRMRPANFPSVRIAQWTTLLFRTGQLFSKMLVAQNLREIENAFVVELSNYWQTHFRFDKASKKSAKTLGKARIHLLVINIIAPFIFLYGKKRGADLYQERALRLMEAVPAENNHILAEWKALGIEAKQAGQSQALLQLKNSYCQEKRCLDCAIGCSILKRKPDVMEEDVLYLPSWWLLPAAATTLAEE